MEKKTAKEVKKHKFLACACKSQDFAQGQKDFARSHDRTTARFRNSETFLSFCVLDDFFPFFKKLGFWVFLVHPETTLPDGLETSGQRVYR